MVLPFSLLPLVSARPITPSATSGTALLPLAGDTAPAQGLFLYKVNYSEEEAGNAQAAQEITAKQE